MIELFIKNFEHDNLLVKIYVDDIISDVTNESLCKDFYEMIHNEFEILTMREIHYFLGL